MAFNEDSRVKIPAILHLIRLGYNYIPRREQNRFEETNIFPNIFFSSVQRINPAVETDDVKRYLEELTLKLDFDDLGKEFGIYRQS